MEKYFVDYTICDEDFDREIKFGVSDKFCSIYALPKIDITKRGGPIFLMQGDINNPEEAKIVRTFLFIDAKRSEDLGKNKQGWQKYCTLIGLDIDAIVAVNPESKTTEIVDWESYQALYDDLHKDYIKNFGEVKVIEDPENA